MTARTLLKGSFWSLTALAGDLCGAALAGPEPVAEAPTKTEVAGLTGLHRHAVKLFIDRTGFGFSRIEPPLTDVLGPPKSHAQSAADQLPAVKDPVAIRPGKDGKTAHFSFARAVGVAGFIPATDGKKTWVVKEVQLIGLVKHKDPVVYLTAAEMKETTDEKTREPDKFEAKALEVIRGGGELVQAEKRSGTLRAVSGIFAGKQCAGCHERPGEMLGAFSYRLALEDPPAKPLGGGLPLRP